MEKEIAKAKVILLNRIFARPIELSNWANKLIKVTLTDRPTTLKLSSADGAVNPTHCLNLHADSSSLIESCWGSV